MKYFPIPVVMVLLYQNTHVDDYNTNKKNKDGGFEFLAKNV